MTPELQIQLDRQIARRLGRVRRAFLVGTIHAGARRAAPEPPRPRRDPGACESGLSGRLGRTAPD